MTAALKNLRELLAKATPGPWHAWKMRNGGDGHWMVARTDRRYQENDMMAQMVSVGGNGSNAQLIAAAINSLPALISITEAAHSACLPPREGAYSEYAHAVRMAKLRDTLALLGPSVLEPTARKEGGT